jgi:O-antigen/teichoic acid export membrane protein
MTYMGFGVMMFVMLFSFFGRELVDLLAKEDVYLQAAKVIPIVSLGIYFGMLKDVSLIGLNITKKTGSIAITTFVVTGLSLLLNILLIPYLGILGSAFSNLITQIVFFAVIFTIAQKHYPIPYELGKIMMMILLAGGLFVLASLSNEFSLWLRLPIKFLLICLFPILLFWFGFYEPVEKERIAGFWKKWKNPLLWKKNLQELQF